MIKELESHSLFVFKEALEKKDSLLIEGLWDSCLSFLISEAFKRTEKSILIITSSSREDKLFDNLSFFSKERPVEFPSWETLPGEEIAPSPDILGKRFEALYSLIHRKTGKIVLTPLPSLLQKLASKKALQNKLLIWKKGTKVLFDNLAKDLTNLGYKRAPVVSDKGEFAVRGGILDLFPTASSDPYRIEFFGDEIEQIRTFDPVGQKSIEKAGEIFLSPADELSLLKEEKELETLLDYLEKDSLIIWDDLVSIEETFATLKKMPGSKSPYFLNFEELFEKLSAYQHLFFTKEKIEELSHIQRKKEKTKFFEEISFEMFSRPFTAKRFFHPFRKIDTYFTPDEFEEGDWLEHFQPHPNLKLLFLNANETEEKEVREKLKNISLPKDTSFEQGYLHSGFVITDIPFALIPNVEITHRSKIRRQKWRSTYHTPASDFHQLTPNDLVVHFHSGIGKFLGMEKQINHLGEEAEFLVIEYAEKSKLFVPISQAYLVSRYIGSREEAPSLSQLGTKRWQKVRQTAQAQILGYANDLLSLYAERAVVGGFHFSSDGVLMQQFEENFPYEETQDQFFAIQAIKEDMSSKKAMDRLICGDVGYGKTEVAMRAAFKAVSDGGKQVAVLVPTTVLAMQHFDTFKERMGAFPLQVGVLSRFQTAKQNKETLQKIASHQIDILVGTHRILSKDVLFKDLGLVIIDEEQRFGVRAKEHLKKFKAGVDCLTLSATPIPRTLYMSLVNARDMSVINTPPQDRLPIKTIIAEMENTLIENALLREFSRDGQAFFIHNRVESIHKRAADIQKLVPRARIGIVHGQMDPEEVDSVFHKFKLGSLDLLFATTIVENGIDVPNANTILIDRADTYGLADLYQLRGRVGRWNKSAYAYFLIPKNTRLPEIARKRLNALAEASGYGGGMKVAMRDLEIRGAGDILGVEQSGQVSQIGFHLYCKLLKRAIDALKKQKPISFHETKMEFSFPAALPESYIGEVSIRMEIYHRLGDAASQEELKNIFEELKDRFGKPPLEVIWLYHLSKIRVFAKARSITSIKFNHLSFSIEIVQGKKAEKKTFLLPKKNQTPETLETYVLEKLSAL